MAWHGGLTPNRSPVIGRGVVLAVQYLADRFLQYAAALDEGGLFFGPKVDFDVALHPGSTNNGWDRQADVAQTIGTAHQGTDGQNPVVVESDAMNDIRDGYADRETSSAFLLDHFGSAAASFLFNFGDECGVDAWKFFKWQIGNLSGLPDWHHAVAVFAEDRDVDLCRRNGQSLSQHASQSCCVEYRAKPDDL